MAPPPAFHGLALRRILVLAVGQHIQELHGGLLPHRIPTAPHRFAGPVYASNPSPALRKAASASRIFLSRAFRFAGFFVRFSTKPK